MERTPKPSEEIQSKAVRVTYEASLKAKKIVEDAYFIPESVRQELENIGVEEEEIERRVQLTKELVITALEGTLARLKKDEI